MLAYAQSCSKSPSRSGEERSPSRSIGALRRRQAHAKVEHNFQLDHESSGMEFIHNLEESRMLVCILIGNINREGNVKRYYKMR